MPLDGLRIRHATPADLPAVLGAYVAAGINDPGETLDLERARALLARFATYPSYTLWVAELGGRFVGTYALLVMDNLGHGGARSGVVEDLAVLPEYQGQGIGRAMMEHAMDACARAGCYKLTLSSSARRRDAHAFYEHLGFERHGYSFLVPIAPARAPQSGPAADDDTACDVCGGPTYARHCKIICRVCGYTRDCTDL